MISALLNILWVVLGGFVMALGWWLAGLLCAITIVGLPWARSCFVIGRFSLWPFGQEAVNRQDLSGRGDLGTDRGGARGMGCHRRRDAGCRNRRAPSDVGARAPLVNREGGSTCPNRGTREIGLARGG